MLALALAAAFAPPGAPAQHPRGRIVIVMVWDGLRPDLVTARDTPALYAMARAGVRFDRHHSVYPTQTMVNAAALAAGAGPGETGILADSMYLLPALSKKGAALAKDPGAGWIAKPLDLENSRRLAKLNGPGAFAGRLLSLDTVAQELEREGGYLAVLGKDGPAFLWDNRVASVASGHDSLFEAHKNYLFATDRTVAPAPVVPAPVAPTPLAPAPPGALAPASAGGVVDSARDEYFTRLAVERALPAARDAARAGRPALIVLWQHNPDATQHYAGLGTAPALEALGACDRNLAKIRAAVAAASIADRTDLIAVSDHGFATVRLTVDLNALLAAAGLKKSPESDDVVVAQDSGADLVYLSRTAFPATEARRAELQKIAGFAEAQEWCGPIFSRRAAPAGPGGRPAKPYLGWIGGTFAQQVVGIFDPARSPDLAVSFREIPDETNRLLTGPANPAFTLGRGGQRLTPNKSKPLVRAVPGLVYADAPGLTTGMGTHGAAGARELRSFCAALGPDFRRGFADRLPTASTDIAPTIAHVLGLLPNIGPGGLHPSGRVITEALIGERRPRAGPPRMVTMTARLELQGVKTITTLRFTRFDGRDYLDDSSVERDPLGSSP